MNNAKNRTIMVAALAALAIAVALGIWWLASSASAPARHTTVDPTLLVREHSPREGRSKAPVVVVEFFDPACGTCRSFFPMVKGLMAQHPGHIQLVMRYAPFHAGSDKVVALLAAARKQGKFWEALEALFDSQDDWASNHTAKADVALKHLAGLGLNMEQLAFDLTSPEIAQAVDQDLKDANALGVAQTPEYFVNGRPLPSFGFQQLQQLIAEEVAKAR